VIVQAGASEAQQLAAETAEAVFAGGGGLADGQRLYADIKDACRSRPRSDI
jgi:alkanesulfonate monooxygenase SsuD/methylene tetrahydromethanopterin reductase-like flavin-dependent oxidoreductase (luciferase family)